MEDPVAVQGSQRPRRPPRPARARAPLVCALIACACFQLLGQAAGGASAVRADHAVVVASRPGASGALVRVLPHAVAGTAAWRGSARQSDYDDDYDYQEDGGDDEDDYDYYGTKQKKKKKKKPAAPQPITINETNAFNFVRIMVLRFVWGLASMFGFDEQLADVFNGAFVPPGVDVDDLGDDGLGFDY